MDTPIHILIQRLIENNATKTEADYLLKIINDRPELLDDYFNQNEFESLEANGQLPPQIRDNINAHVLHKISNRKAGIRKLLPLLAAAGCILLFIILFMNTGKRSKADGQLAQKATRTEQLAPSTQTVTNEGAESQIINLPDHSVVILEPLATIKYPTHFTEGRDISLMGKAYFKVAQDKAHPFTVHTNLLQVTALGTEFWVSTDSDDSTIRVELKEGKVQIRPVSRSFVFKEVTLEPDQDFIVNQTHRTTFIYDHRERKTNKKSKSEAFAEQSLVTISGDEIRFSYTPLPDVIQILEQHFNIVILADESFPYNNRFTGKILMKDSLTTILQKVMDLYEPPVTVRQEGDTIYLRKRPYVNQKRQSGPEPPDYHQQPEHLKP